MSRIDKLIARFKSKPKNFNFNELIKILNHFGYELVQGSGSRVIFVNKNLSHKIKLHQPHPGNILKRYQIDLIEAELKLKGLL
jgi:predicted RNA binding protein YcfA (HicA-like mRNA interferase family)